MINEAWSKAVPIRLGAMSNVSILVTDSSLAALILFEHWRGDVTPLVQAARWGCVVALEGGDAEAARSAFEAAVREAGLLIE